MHIQLIISSNKMQREIYYTVTNELKERGNGGVFLATLPIIV